MLCTAVHRQALHFCPHGRQSWRCEFTNRGIQIKAATEQVRHNLPAVTEGPLPTDILTAIDDAALKARPKWPPYFYGGEPVVTNSCAYLIYTRGCGCIGHPALLAPSVFRGTKIMHNSGASRRGIEATHLFSCLKKIVRGSENSACPFPVHRPIRLTIRSGAH